MEATLSTDTHTVMAIVLLLDIVNFQFAFDAGALHCRLEFLRASEVLSLLPIGRVKENDEVVRVIRCAEHSAIRQASRRPHRLVPVINESLVS